MEANSISLFVNCDRSCLYFHSVLLLFNHLNTRILTVGRNFVQNSTSLYRGILPRPLDKLTKLYCFKCFKSTRFVFATPRGSNQTGSAAQTYKLGSLRWMNVFENHSRCEFLDLLFSRQIYNIYIGSGLSG